jgi:hypothetical protein
MAYTFPTASIGNWADLRTALNSELPVKWSREQIVNTVQSTSSKSLVTLDSATISLLSDEICIIWSSVTASVGTANASVEFAHRVSSGTVRGSSLIFEPTSTSTDGQRVGGNLISLLTGSGSIDIDLKWRRKNGSGTVYLYNSTIIPLIFKTRT